MASILVLDDQAANRELLATVVASAGHTVLEADNGKAALELARAARPDVVIADILMPGMDGYEFVRQLRHDPLVASTRVVFYTATYIEDEARRLAASCGVEHFLFKPCEPEQILAVTALALGCGPVESAATPVAAGFDREHMQILNDKLIAKVDELEAVNWRYEQLNEELRKVERQTAESLALLETLLATAPVGLCFVDRESQFRHINETLAAVSGLSIEDHVGRSVVDVVPELWEQIGPFYRQVLETGKPVFNREIAGVAPAEPTTVRSWLASFYPVAIGGEVIGVGTVVVDITAREQAEALRSAVMDNMAEGLYVMDAVGRLTYMNAAAETILGWKEADLRGESVHAAIHYQHADGSPFSEDDCDLLSVRSNDRSTRVADDTLTRRDGTTFPVAYSAAPLHSGTSVSGVVVVFRDASEEQAERLRVQRELDALSWLGRTRDALAEDRLVLYMQPVVPLTGGEPAVELLVRMVGKDGAIIAPGNFLPVAEKYGLITEIDTWVVKQAIGLAAAGRRVEVNLSGDSIGNPDLLSLIKDELVRTGADPWNLIFEITETALMRHAQAGEAFVRSLAQLGSRIALDDFGTGFGSFTYLTRMPVHYLKIDIQFVIDLPGKPANQQLVKAIVNLAQSLGHQSVAEGVEDEDTLDLLRDYGVDYVQGFHIGRPAPIDA